MSSYWKRHIDQEIEDGLKTFGGLVLEGPRASGKTKSGSQFSRSSIRLDSDPMLPGLAETSPHVILDGASPRLIDEWQLAPALWNATRFEIDQRVVPGQFILTGSATPSDDQTHHSGAGRFGRIRVRTMSLSESKESTEQVSLSALMAGEAVAGIGGIDVPGYADVIERGGWPALVVTEGRNPQTYLKNYLDDVARVDLTSAGLPADPVRVASLIRAVARNTSSERAATRLASEAEISAQSARTYLDALARVFVVEELPAWTPHLRSNIRLRTQPKWHFVDPSLSVAALGGSAHHLLDDLEFFGFLFESLCIRDLRIYAQVLGGRVYHYRDSSGLEVDAVVELRDGSWGAFEVKIGGAEAIEKAAQRLLSLRDKVSDARRRSSTAVTVLTAGNTSYQRKDGVNVVSLGHLTV